jgi:hypothetical protein
MYYYSLLISTCGYSWGGLQLVGSRDEAGAVRQSFISRLDTYNAAVGIRVAGG